MNLSETVRVYMGNIDYETELTKQQVAESCDINIMQASNRLSKLFRDGTIGRRGMHGNYKYFKTRNKPILLKPLTKQTDLIEGKTSDVEFLENLLAAMAKAEPIIKRMIKIQKAFDEV